MIKQERYVVGEPAYDVAVKFFTSLDLDKFESKYIEIENYLNSDSKLHALIADDKIIAFVIERRTAFNNIEYTFGSLI